MLKYKTFTIAVVFAAFLLIGFVGINDAIGALGPIGEPIEIEELRSYNGTTTEYDYGDPYFTFYIRTDKPYAFILWYVDNVLEGRSEGDGTKTEDYFSFSNLPGNLKGKKYKIKAVAFPLGRVILHADSETYNFTVYKPISTSAVTGNNGIILHPGVYGYVALTGHYFDGTNIIMDGYVHASNPTNTGIQCESWFRHTEYDGNGKQAKPTGWKRISNGPSKTIRTGDPKYDSTYYAYSNSMTDYFVGGPIGPDDEYYLNAHIHLETGQDDRHVDSVPFIITFTDEDNPKP